MDGAYVGVLTLVCVAAIIGGTLVTLSWLLGPKSVTPSKNSPYECGVEPVGDTHERFPIKFYLVAIVFILFDIEVVFLWPWMTVFKNADTPFLVFSFFEFLIYMGTWILGYAYILRMGATDWDEATTLHPSKLGSELPIDGAKERELVGARKD